MTAIEHQELKGITVKNLIVTIVSTTSIVASIMTTYFGLKTDISEIKATQETETKINNIRIKMLEDEVTLLQKTVNEIKITDIDNTYPHKTSLTKAIDPALLSSNKKINQPNQK